MESGVRSGESGEVASRQSPVRVLKPQIGVTDITQHSQTNARPMTRDYT
jgi:hypothetical protein